jgi:hypothetical protein
MVFGFLANLTNYGPKDFKGKTVKDILAMKPGKVGDDFFGADNEKAIAEAGLMREQLQAIELLMDLKNKEKIMEKCYVNRPTNRYSVVPGHSSMRKEHGESARHGHVEAKPVHVEAAKPVEAKPVEAAPHVEKEDERELVPCEGEQQGGGGRHKHTRLCGHKRSGHKRSGHTKHGGHKRSGHKHTKRSGHKHSGHKRKRSGHKRKRSGHKRSGYTGGKGPVLSPRSY